MGFSQSFLFGLAWRVGLLVAAAFLLVHVFTLEGLAVVRIVASLAFAATLLALWNYVRRTNIALARFVEAIQFGDLSQNAAGLFRDSGFGEISEALNNGMRKLRDERHQLAESNRFYEAVVDDAPAALLTVFEGRVELANKAARRLFIRHNGVRVEDFAIYGRAFARSLSDGPVGRPRLLPVSTESVPQTAMVSAGLVQRAGELVRVVAVQPIQSELNALEVAAQSDLIRVLTHEIMNSMTPVTSLAQTAARLMADADRGDDPDFSDARMAVETLARRADGVMHFVQSYRQISRAPQIRPQVIEAAPWAAELRALIRATWPEAVLQFDLRIEPDYLSFEADRDLTSQVLINLLRNAAEVATGHDPAPRISLAIRRTMEGRILIEVEDNGPGVPDSLRQDIFLPFFTTKAQGTGVGLSLARQVVLAHHGSIHVENRPGACFRILL